MSASDDSLLEVGRIVKAHGIRGEVAVVLTSNRSERTAPGSVLHTDRGPLTVRSSRPHQAGYVVAFEGVADRNAAERLHGLTLRAPRLDLDDDDDVIWIDDLFRATVVTSDGIERGVVVEVMENPASDILILDTGFLVPLTFVVEVEANTRIVVETPEGLFE
jgi:16S rRNA processing protein RimM